MPGTGWTVTGQATDQIQQTDAGQVIEGVNVYFVTAEGNTGYVFVPNTHYHNTKIVHDMIRKQAAQMDTIGNLAENYPAG